MNPNDSHTYTCAHTPTPQSHFAPPFFSLLLQNATAIYRTIVRAAVYCVIVNVCPNF